MDRALKSNNPESLAAIAVADGTSSRDQLQLVAPESHQMSQGLEDGQRAGQMEVKDAGATAESGVGLGDVGSEIAIAGVGEEEVAREQLDGHDDKTCGPRSATEPLYLATTTTPSTNNGTNSAVAGAGANVGLQQSPIFQHFGMSGKDLCARIVEDVVATHNIAHSAAPGTSGSSTSHSSRSRNNSTSERSRNHGSSRSSNTGSIGGGGDAMFAGSTQIRHGRRHYSSSEAAPLSIHSAVSNKEEGAETREAGALSLLQLAQAPLFSPPKAFHGGNAALPVTDMSAVPARAARVVLHDPSQHGAPPAPPSSPPMVIE